MDDEKSQKTEIENVEKCGGCGRTLCCGIRLHRLKDELENVNFPYLKLGESMHLECYINRVIEEKLNEKLQKNIGR